MSASGFNEAPDNRESSRAERLLEHPRGKEAVSHQEAADRLLEERPELIEKFEAVDQALSYIDQRMVQLRDHRPHHSRDQENTEATLPDGLANHWPRPLEPARRSWVNLNPDTTAQAKDPAALATVADATQLVDQLLNRCQTSRDATAQAKDPVSALDTVADATQFVDQLLDRYQTSRDATAQQQITSEIRSLAEKLRARLEHDQETPFLEFKADHNQPEGLQNLTQWYQLKNRKHPEEPDQWDLNANLDHTHHLQQSLANSVAPGDLPSQSAQLLQLVLRRHATNLRTSLDQQANAEAIEPQTARSLRRDQAQLTYLTQGQERQDRSDFRENGLKAVSDTANLTWQRYQTTARTPEQTITVTAVDFALNALHKPKAHADEPRQEQAVAETGIHETIASFAEGFENDDPMDPRAFHQVAASAPCRQAQFQLGMAAEHAADNGWSPATIDRLETGAIQLREASRENFVDAHTDYATKYNATCHVIVGQLAARASEQLAGAGELSSETKAEIDHSLGALKDFIYGGREVNPYSYGTPEDITKTRDRRGLLEASPTRSPVNHPADLNSA